MKNCIAITIRIDASDFDSIEELRSSLGALGMSYRMTFNGVDYRFVIGAPAEAKQALKALAGGLAWGVNYPNSTEFAGEVATVEKIESQVH